MKRIISYITTGLVAASLFAGCSADNAEGYPERNGYLVFSAGFGETRAAVTPDYTVKIGTSKGYTHSFAGSEAPSELKLVTGDYYIEVESGTPPQDAWAADLYYYHREGFTITKGKTTTLDIECTPRNTFLSIDFDESVTKWMSEYSVTLFPDPEYASEKLVFDESNAGGTANVVLADGQTDIGWTFDANHKTDGKLVPKTGTLTGLEAGKSYAVSFKYSFKEGAFSLTVTVDESTDDKGHAIAITPGGRIAADPVSKTSAWATHADVTGTASEDAAEVKFAYHKKSGGDLQYAAATHTGDGKYSATLTGLTPGTEYEIRIWVDNGEGGEPAGTAQTFITDAATPLPNGGFDSWYQDGDKVWYPNASGQAFWDSGNKGTVTAPLIGSENNNITTRDTARPDSPGSYSAKLKSNWFGAMGIGAFAAGNIYVGKFGSTVVSTNPSGTVEFGRPFTTRPLAMKVWYKANTGTVNYAKKDAPLSTGQQDKYQILIALAYIENPRPGGLAVQVNTADWSTFINYETDARIIAHGSLESSENKGWTSATIKLDYGSDNRIPTHIIVLASASMYGDYFTGSTSSELWVDDFELIYDPAELQ